MNPLSFREEGAIVLISSYELGHQPMGLSWPAAFLERAGYRPVCLDTSIEGFEPERVRQALFIGISVPMHTALRLGYRIALRVREINAGCHICFYGLYALLNAGYLLENVANSVMGGEYEESLTRLIERLEQKGEVWSGGCEAGTKPCLERLDFPLPRREGLPPQESYVRLDDGADLLVTGYVEASRGCRHHCLHCPIPPVYGGRFFVVPREVVLQDIRKQAEKGARHITFADPDFLNGPGHSLKIVKAMHQEFPFLTFDFTAKVEHLLRHRALLRGFADCGCIFIVSAVESLNDRVLANLRKGHTRADFFAVLEVVRGAGIELRPSLLSFTPWTSLEDYLDVLDTVEQEDLIDRIDPVQYAVRLLVPPGSALLGQPEIQPYLGRLRAEQFTYEWAHPDPRMDLLHKDISRIVEEAAAAGEDIRTTFLRIRNRAQAARYGYAPLNRAIPPGGPRRPLRLTEPWFC